MPDNSNNFMGDVEPPEPRYLTVFYLVDTSGSMSGVRIGAANDALRTCIGTLKEVQDEYPGRGIKMAVLSFNTEAKWHAAPTLVDNYAHENLTAGGLTKFGAACEELESKLHRDSFMAAARTQYAPVFILISDGEPTDDWKKGLEKLKKNGWFKGGIKIAIDVDGESDRSVLEAFTGNVETVIETKSAEELKNMIDFLSGVSSTISSSGGGQDSENSTGQVAKKIIDHQEEMNNTHHTSIPPEPDPEPAPEPKPDPTPSGGEGQKNPFDEIQGDIY